MKDIAENFGKETDRKIGASWFFGIGIGKYKEFDQLHNPEKDVTDILDTLKDRYIIDEDKIKTLFNEEATRENIINYLDELHRKVRPEDKLLIYFSGHGKLLGTQGYWIPYEGRKGKTDSYIGYGELLSKIRDINSKDTLLLIDSCYAGSIFLPKSRDTFEERSGNLKSRYAICSGGHDEKVSDGPFGENSPFAACVREKLEEKKSSNLRASELAVAVWRKLAENEPQVPMYGPLSGVGHEGGEYLFESKEEETWKFSKAKNTPESYAYYLDKFPDGPHATEAIQLKEQSRILNNDRRERRIFNVVIIGILLIIAGGFIHFLNGRNDNGLTGNGNAEDTSEDTVPDTVIIQPDLQPRDQPPLEIPLATISDPSYDEVAPEASGLKFGDRSYPVKFFSGLRWITENLDFDIGKGGWCYEKKIENCGQFGRLYTWEAAREACRKMGWRLPEDRDWQELADTFGGYTNAESGTKYGNSQNASSALLRGGVSGFDAVKGGYRHAPRDDLRYSEEDFDALDERGIYWTDTPAGPDSVWVFDFTTSGDLYRYRDHKENGFSCRCVERKK